jgi:DNA-directed RNA polymerase beta' subunit
LEQPGKNWIEISSKRLFNADNEPAKFGPIDLRLGPVFGHSCQTCGQKKCNGHFGYIKLPMKKGDGVRNPLFGNVMAFLPIMPTPSRKIAILDGKIVFDDITLTYVTILGVIDKFSHTDSELLPEPIWQDLKSVLQFYIDILFENKHGKTKKQSNQPYKGYIDDMRGKQGLLRRECLGKRTKSMARTVFSVDPNLSIDELGVPEEFVDCLETQDAYTPERAHCKRFLFVIDTVTGQRFKVKYFHPQAGIPLSRYRLVRPIHTGDWAMMNRAPSLHKYSILAFRVKIMPGRTLRINPMCCASFNADCDGDAVNIIVPQSDEAKRDCETKMLASLNIKSVRHGKNIIAPSQDFKVAAWLQNVTELDTKEQLDAFSKTVAPVLKDQTCLTFSKESMWIVTTRAGSRGDPEQYRQMWERGLDHPITMMPKNITLARGDYGPRQSYRAGLPPGHFWEACHEGRISIVQRSMGPSRTGYMQRKLIFCAGDLRWDGNQVVDSYKRPISNERFDDMKIGTYVGILMAQSFGELSTQTVLRSFHRPGEIDVDAFTVLEKLLMHPTGGSKASLISKLHKFFTDQNIAIDRRWIRLLADIKFYGGYEHSLGWGYVLEFKPPLHSLGFERIHQNLQEIIGKTDTLDSPFSQVIVGSYKEF